MSPPGDNLQGSSIAPVKTGRRYPSVLSAKWINQLVDTCNAVRNLKVVPGPRLDFKLTKFGAVLTVPGANQSAASEQRFHPFKLYNVPKEFCADPANDWRTFQVNGGLAAFRSQTGALGDGGAGGPLANLFLPVGLTANSEAWTQVIRGTDGSYGQVFSQASRDYFAAHFAPRAGYEVVTIPNDPAGVTSDQWCQFLLDPDYVRIEGFPITGAAFWLEFVDAAGPAEFFTVRIRARLFGDPAISTDPFPTSPFVVPIGSAIFLDYDGATPSPSIVEQYLTDHLINRYPSGYGKEIGDPSPVFWRGYWDDDGLDGLMFYPGDLVGVLKTGPDVLRLFIYKTAPGIYAGTPPDVGDFAWTLIAKTVF